MLEEDRVVAQLQAANGSQSRQEILSELREKMEKAGVEWKDNLACKEWYESNKEQIDQLSDDIGKDLAMEQALEALQ